MTPSDFFLELEARAAERWFNFNDNPQIRRLTVQERSEQWQMASVETGSWDANGSPV